jgi:hypothetical protein
MPRMSFVVLIVVFAHLQSCDSEHGATLTTTGTIALRSDAQDFKGFYYIKADDGKEYYPVNPPDEFQSVGLRVRFEAKEVNDGALIVGWGRDSKIELVHIQKL